MVEIFGTGLCKQLVCWFVVSNREPLSENGSRQLSSINKLWFLWYTGNVADGNITLQRRFPPSHCSSVRSLNSSVCNSIDFRQEFLFQQGQLVRSSLQLRCECREIVDERLTFSKKTCVKNIMANLWNKRQIYSQKQKVYR